MKAEILKMEVAWLPELNRLLSKNVFKFNKTKSLVPIKKNKL